MFFTGGCGGGAGTAAAATTTAGTAAVKKFYPHRMDLCADRIFFGVCVSFRIPVYGLFYLGKVRCCVYIVVLLYDG